MLWKLEHPVTGRRRGRPETAPAPDEAFPTPGAVLAEMALTVAVFLVIALAMHLLVDGAGF